MEKKATKRDPELDPRSLGTNATAPAVGTCVGAVEVPETVSALVVLGASVDVSGDPVNDSDEVDVDVVVTVVVEEIVLPPDSPAVAVDETAPLPDPPVDAVPVLAVGLELTSVVEPMPLLGPLVVPVDVELPLSGVVSEEVVAVETVTPEEVVSEAVVTEVVAVETVADDGNVEEIRADEGEEVGVEEEVGAGEEEEDVRAEEIEGEDVRVVVVEGVAEPDSDDSVIGIAETELACPPEVDVSEGVPVTSLSGLLDVGTGVGSVSSQ